MLLYRAALFVLLLLLLADGSTARPFRHKDVLKPKPHMRLRHIDDADFDEFVCEVCQAFCVEFERTVGSKATDDHWMLAVDWARGNASNYGWEKETKRLRSPQTRAGVEVIDSVYDVLDHALLDHFAVEIILHALHATAHRQQPVKVNWGFARQVWCVEHAKVCPALEQHAGQHVFGTLRHDFDAFKRVMEHQNAHLHDDLTPRQAHRHSETFPDRHTALPDDDPARLHDAERHRAEHIYHDEM